MAVHRFKCPDCSATWGSGRSLAAHRRIHKPKPRPYIPPPAPKRTTIEEVPSSFSTDNEDLTLLDCKLKVGDTFYHVRKFVITRTERVEGSKDVKVRAKCTKRHYSLHEPT